MIDDKLTLKEKLLAIDLNSRDLWDTLSEESQTDIKKDFFILNRYISNVKGQSREVQEHFVLGVNEVFNKNFYAIQKNHPKLLWLLLCMCSYNHGSEKFFHEWIGNKKKDGASSTNKKVKFLADLYPSMKMDEIEMMAKLYTDKDLMKLGKEHGFDDNTIKKNLK
jgi:hypothetical protein